MKANNHLIFKRIGMVFSLLIISLFLIPSCDKEEEPAGDPLFFIEGDPTGLSVDKNAKTQSYTVRSNRPWQIIAKSEADWVRPFPDEGADDGIFKIIVEANPTFDERTVNYAFVVDGKEQPVLFRIDQEGNVPYITLPALVTIPSAGGDVEINVTSNVAWSYTISDNSWLTEKSVTTTRITLTAAENTSIDPRQVVLTVTASDFPAVSANVTLAQSPGTVVLEENFNWLAYGSAVFYTTTGETRYDLWTQAEKDRGWVSTVNTTAVAGQHHFAMHARDSLNLEKPAMVVTLFPLSLQKLQVLKTCASRSRQSRI